MYLVIVLQSVNIGSLLAHSKLRVIIGINPYLGNVEYGFTKALLNVLVLYVQYDQLSSVVLPGKKSPLEYTADIGVP
ncbi:hypothetical protein [Peribacillus simplex]|uniref:hypothetical protein n=1 Tax=Peribacillus simplex TaxID=1478 RepID=UPI003D2AF184